MSYVDKIVGAFGGVRSMATAIQSPASTVQGWKTRGTIPDREKRRVLSAAIALDLGLTSDDFLPFDQEDAA